MNGRFPGAPRDLDAVELDLGALRIEYRDDAGAWRETSLDRLRAGNVIRLFRRDESRFVGVAGERQWYVKRRGELVPSLSVNE